MQRWPIAILSLCTAFAAVPWIALGFGGGSSTETRLESAPAPTARGATIAGHVESARPGAKLSEARADVTPPSIDAPVASAAPAPGPVKQRQGGLDATFIVAADTHIGYATPDRPGQSVLEQPLGIEQTNLLMIEHMNEIPGKPWPGGIGGRVDLPRGVLLAGDLTEDGGEVDWRMFEALYGRTGKEGPLRYPIYEGDGNHDQNRDWFIREEIARRHGGRFYSFDFDDLHLVCLGEAPDDEGLAFLSRDLEKVAADVPVVVYFHFPLLGAFSENNWFGRGNYRDRLELALSKHRVIGIFHGHRHDSGAYRWRGYPVYSVGSPKHAWRSFVVVRVTDTQLSVASWNYERGKFWWWHQVPLDGGEQPELKGTTPPMGGDPTPELLLD